MGKETFKEQVWNDATGTFYTQIVARIFSQTRQGLVGSPDILTEKHAVKRLLGMRTRGQATLEEGSGAHSKGIVLAKAGIKTPTHTTTVAEQNDYIVESFMNRIPQLPGELRSTLPPHRSCPRSEEYAD